MKALNLLFCLLFSSLATPCQDSSLMITEVGLIDGTGSPLVPKAWILVEGNRISKVQAAPIEAPAGCELIDGRGKFLIPGLMDLHVHLRRGTGEPGIRALHGYLYSGFTTIYDAGNDPDFIFGLRDQERSDTIISPRIFATGGVVTVPGGHGGGRGATLVDRWPEAIPALDEHLARKPDLLKLTYDEHGWGTRPLIPLLPVELMRKVIDYYHQHGVRSTVHISHEYRAREAIDAGVDTLAHPIIQGPVSDEFVNIMASTKVPMVSTLTIGEGYSRLVDHPEFLDQELYRTVMSSEDIERLRGPIRERYEERSWTWWMKIMTPVAQENLRKIHAAGGILVCGSDQSLGPASHRELELMVAAGISAIDVIRIATLNGAIFLGREQDLGSIEAGKLADMVLLGSDPSVDIDHAKDIALVIKAGRVIDRQGLDLPGLR